MILKENNCTCHPEVPGEVVFETKDYNFNATDANIAILSCIKCGSLYPDKFPTDESLFQLYVNYYTSIQKTSGFRKIFHFLVKKLQKTTRLRNTPQDSQAIFDYGCGSGEYLHALSKLKYRGKLYGSDIIEPEAADNFFQWVPMEMLDKLDGKLDWITMSHVLEHVPNPYETVTQLTSYLTERGAIWISTPNANSFLIDCFKGWARDVDFPRHRQIFSYTGLCEFLNRCGLEPEFRRTDKINSVLNFLSCFKNLSNESEVSLYFRLRLLSKAMWQLIKYLIFPRGPVDSKAPELVVICTKVTGGL